MIAGVPGDEVRLKGRGSLCEWNKNRYYQKEKSERGIPLEPIKTTLKEGEYFVSTF